MSFRDALAFFRRGGARGAMQERKEWTHEEHFMTQKQS
jgi:hypothetical protein